ncbi:MAG: opuAB, partial [Steroidobacteraceae bacterium]|nr:opuAB [Steroidobacteraceae bacterium]
MRMSRCRGASVLRRTRGTPDLLLAMLLALASVGNAFAASADPAGCRTVRLSDVGWTAESATTAIFGQILTEIGYQPTITVLSVPVTFESMRNGDIDAFLGNWLPAQGQMLQPFLDDGSVEHVRVNLDGAKYTLAVPAYLHEAGLEDFADIAKFREELGGVIY